MSELKSYISNAYLAKDGKVYVPGEVIVISKEVAKFLGDKVSATSTATVKNIKVKGKSAIDYESLTVAELRLIAEEKEIEGYKGLKKSDLIILIKKA